MKILKLRFKNVNSLKGENEIDFTVPPLSETGIFAITGPTGAGKTTLLDVISLALFNKTPRVGNLSKKTIEDLGSVITRNTDDCYAEIEYEVREKVYRSKWAISRARTGNLRDYSMEITELGENKIFDLKKKDVPAKNAELIGLNYEQFEKAIVLSQGEFAKFLKANANERGELLEKITGTEIYRKIGRAVFEKQKQEKMHLDSLKLRQEEITTLSDEEAKEIKKSNEKLVEVIEHKKLEINEIELIVGKKELLRKSSLSVSKSEVALKSAEAKLVSFSANAKKIELHKKLFVHKPEIERIKIFNNELKVVKQKLSRQTKDILVYEKIIKKLSNSKTECSQKITLQESEIKKYQPILKQTRVFDTQVDAQKKQLSNEKSGLQMQNKEMQVQKVEIDSLKKKHHQDLGKLQDVEKWLKSNELYNDLEKELQSINDKIAQFIHAEDAAKKFFEKQKNISIAGISSRHKVNWSKKSVEIKNRKDETFSKIKHELTLINGKPEFIAEYRNLLSELRAQSSKIENVARISKSILELLQKIETGNKRIITVTKEIETSEETVVRSRNDFELLQLKIEELEIRYKRQELEQSLDKQRVSLVENEPCPLCGSLEHPFVQSYENVIDMTKGELQNLKNRRKKTQHKIGTLDKKIAELSKEKTMIASQLDAYVTEKSVLESQFEQLTKDEDWNFTSKQTSLIAQTTNAIATESEKIKNEILHCDKYVTLKSEHELLELCEGKMLDISKLQVDLQNILKKYSIVLKGVSRKNVPVHLKKCVQENNQKKKSQHDYSLRVTQQETSISERVVSYKKLEENFAQENTHINRMEDEIKEILQKRFKLLGKHNPDVFEQSKVREMNNLTKEINNLSEQIAGKKSALESLVIATSEQKIKTEELFAKLETLQNHLLPQIADLGIFTVEEALENILDSKLINTLNKQQKQIDNELIAARQTCINQKSEYDKIFSEIDSVETVKNLKNSIEKLKQFNNDSHKKIGANQMKLKSDAEARKRLEIIMLDAEKQEREFNRWKTLNNVIGDAEGKRFSKFAQEITLKQLINIANNHLKALNERYLLKKGEGNNKDDLIVIDTFQGDNERSVKTLSGGESFLVSLALALGLSDLAGQNVHIGSLFIDEGFGSLDQQSLDLALSSLEKLQNETNKTIGVISHVGSLKERIRTQIVVRKTNSGYSEISKVVL